MRVGDIIDGKYLIIEPIDDGGMGTVLKVLRQETGEELALKYCKENDESTVRRFAREVRIMTETIHPNVIKILDSNVDHVPPYFIMPIALYSIRTLIPKIKGNFKAIMPIFEEICTGIAAMHNSGHFHRDIKPSNALMLKDGQIVVSDFGLSKKLNPDSPIHVSSNSFLGTPGYHAPEQLEAKNSDARTDVYQLGKTLYELYTGDYPYLINPAKITPGLNYIIQRATSTDPANRYQTVGELQQALKTYQLSLDPNSNPKDAFENKLNETKNLLAQGQYSEATNLSLLETLELVKDDYTAFLEYFDRIPAQIIKVLASQMEGVFENTLNIYTKNLDSFFDNGPYDFSYAETVATKMSAVFNATKKVEIKVSALNNILIAAVRCNRYNAMDTFDALLQSIKIDVEAIATLDFLRKEMDWYRVLYDRVPKNKLHYILQPAWDDADNLKQAEKAAEEKEQQKLLDYFASKPGDF